MGRPRKENTTTNAERCKAYRNKSKEENKLNDALRKMIARQKIKQNPTENQLRLKNKAAKRKWRLRKSCQFQLVNILSTSDKNKNIQSDLYTIKFLRTHSFKTKTLFNSITSNL